MVHGRKELIYPASQSSNGSIETLALFEDFLCFKSSFKCFASINLHKPHTHQIMC